MTSTQKPSGDRVDEVLELLRETGYRVTSARRVVLGVLASADAYVTAQELIDAVHDRVPSIGRASVFRTLHLLFEQGFVHSSARGGRTLYALSASCCEHRLVCTSCGAIVSFRECPVGELQQALSKQYDFDIAGHRLEVFGRCADCS